MKQHTRSSRLAWTSVSCLPQVTSSRLISQCSASGVWPEWKERRDKDRKDRIATLKSRKDAQLLQLKEQDNQAEKERRAASLAAPQKAREEAKRLASERAAAANAAKPAKAKSGASAGLDKGKPHAPAHVSDSVAEQSNRRERAQTCRFGKSSQRKGGEQIPWIHQSISKQWE